MATGWAKEGGEQRSTINSSGRFVLEKKLLSDTSAVYYIFIYVCISRTVDAENVRRAYRNIVREERGRSHVRARREMRGANN